MEKYGNTEPINCTNNRLVHILIKPKLTHRDLNTVFIDSHLLRIIIILSFYYISDYDIFVILYCLNDRIIDLCARAQME